MSLRVKFDKFELFLFFLTKLNIFYDDYEFNNIYKLINHI